MAKAANRQARRQRAAQRRRRQNLVWIGGAAVAAALVLAIVVIGVLGQRPVGAEQSLPTQGNLHIEMDTSSPVAYNSTPPTSGPHYESIVPWGVSSEPRRYEHLVHNLEDGGVVIYYQCEDGCPEVVEQLEEIVAPYLSAGRHIVLTPNDPAWSLGVSQPLHQDMEARIALTAWQRIDKFDEVDAERIQAFIERYEGIDNHR